jgi:hypothetical protein
MIGRRSRAAAPRKAAVRAPSRRRPQAGPSTKPSVEECLATEMLSVCLMGLRSFGVDAEKTLKSQRSIRSLNGQVPVARKIFQDSLSLGELATEWMENAHYVDQSGRPSVLPIRGKGATFSTLVQKYFGKRRLDEILDFAMRTRVIERVGSDKVAQVNAVVMLTGDPLLVLARTVLSVRWLLDVARRNGLRASDQSELVPERLACSLIPRARSAEFADLMRPYLYNMTERTNRWLAKYTVRDRRREGDTELVGVHTYVFRD